MSLPQPGTSFGTFQSLRREPPFVGTAEPSSEHDPEAAEAYAETVRVDPSADEIDEYLEIAGAAPLADPTDNARTDE